MLKAKGDARNLAAVVDEALHARLRKRDRRAGDGIFAPPRPAT
jgi:hypothetical protein